MGIEDVLVSRRAAFGKIMRERVAEKELGNKYAVVEGEGGDEVGG